MKKNHSGGSGGVGNTNATAQTKSRKALSNVTSQMRQKQQQQQKEQKRPDKKQRIELHYPCLYMRQELKDSWLHRTLSKHNVKVICRDGLDVDLLLSANDCAVACFKESTMPDSLSGLERQLQAFKNHAAGLVLFSLTSTTQAWFHEFQMHVVLELGYRFIPFSSETELAKYLAISLRTASAQNEQITYDTAQLRVPPEAVLRTASTIPKVKNKAPKLLAEFGALSTLANAGPEDLASVDGLGPATTQHIYDFFHNSFHSEYSM
ncbi:hypothetical protein QOT17_002830 [Balamuthia mandrillaris]